MLSKSWFDQGEIPLWNTPWLDKVTARCIEGKIVGVCYLDLRKELDSVNEGC